MGRQGPAQGFRFPSMASVRARLRHRFQGYKRTVPYQLVFCQIVIANFGARLSSGGIGRRRLRTGFPAIETLSEMYSFNSIGGEILNGPPVTKSAQDLAIRAPHVSYGRLAHS